MGRTSAGILPKASVARIIVKAGAKRVSGDAALALAKILEETGKEIATKAIRVAMHAGRKTVKKSDVQRAVE